jgi:hypothetical protein
MRANERQGSSNFTAVSFICPPYLSSDSDNWASDRRVVAGHLLKQVDTLSLQSTDSFKYCSTATTTRLGLSDVHSFMDINISNRSRQRTAVIHDD